MLTDTYQEQLRQLGLTAEEQRALLALPLVLPFTVEGGSLSAIERDAVVEVGRAVADLNPKERDAVHELCDQPLEGRRRELALDCLEELCRAEPNARVNGRLVAQAVQHADDLVQLCARQNLPQQERNAKKALPEWTDDVVSEGRRQSLHRIAQRLGVKLEAAADDDAPTEQGAAGAADGDTDSIRPAPASRRAGGRRSSPIRRLRTAFRLQREVQREGGLV